MPRIRIAIDADLFSAISDEEKEKITTILKDSNVLTQDGTFEGGGDVIASAASVIADPQGWGLSDVSDVVNTVTRPLQRDLCRSGCDIAAASATAACAAGTSGVALAACIVAAEVARNACRDAC
jgi:hypothetical protein